jgi:hypothetical protein
MLHAEAGYSQLPGSLKWRRDIDLNGKDQVEGGPDMKSNGFYFMWVWVWGYPQSVDRLCRCRAGLFGAGIFTEIVCFDLFHDFFMIAEGIRKKFPDIRLFVVTWNVERGCCN